nr:MAG TPA: hypothetical protein [Caudoviricetes sp.]
MAATLQAPSRAATRAAPMASCMREGCHLMEGRRRMPGRPMSWRGVSCSACWEGACSVGPGRDGAASGSSSVGVRSRQPAKGAAWLGWAGRPVG